MKVVLVLVAMGILVVDSIQKKYIILEATYQVIQVYIRKYKYIFFFFVINPDDQ